MIVISLIMPPTRLTGFLSRYLVEIPPNTFVGNVNPKIRNIIIEETRNGIGRGRGIIMWSNNTPHGYSLENIGEITHPVVDIDGVPFITTPYPPPPQEGNEKYAKVEGGGWSNASKHNSARRYRGR